MGNLCMSFFGPKFGYNPKHVRTSSYRIGENGYIYDSSHVSDLQYSVLTVFSEGAPELLIPPYEIFVCCKDDGKCFYLDEDSLMLHSKTLKGRLTDIFTGGAPRESIIDGKIFDNMKKSIPLSESMFIHHSSK